MDEAFRRYVEAIPPAHRPLFDRLHHLIRETAPTAEVLISYRMPTYRVGRRRLFLATWRHGVSIYGWDQGDDGGFLERHPELKSGRATIRLHPEAAADIPDDEFRRLIDAALRSPA